MTDRRDEDVAYRLGEPVPPVDLVASGPSRAAGPGAGKARSGVPRGPRGPAGPQVRPVGTARRRTNPWRAAFVVLLMLGLVGLAGWVVLGSRLLVVRKVEVVGAHRVSPDEIRAAADVPIGTPLALVHAGTVRDRVQRIPQIEQARVTRVWPATLRISVVERVPAAAVARDGRYLLIDRFGVTVASVAGPPAGLPLLEVPGDLAHNPAVRAAVAVIHSLPAALAGRLAAVQAPDPEQIVLRLRVPGGGDVTVVWGGPERGTEKARLLVALLRHPAVLYDVSSPDVAVVREQSRVLPQVRPSPSPTGRRTP